MNFFAAIYHLFLYQPLFNALVILYEYLPGRDLGIAIIALTFVLRLFLYPLSLQAIRAQKKLIEAQPKVKELQEKFKHNRDELTRNLLLLYQKEKINPFAGFLPLLIQLPVLIALYQVFGKGFQVEQLENLYAFVPHPGELNPSFLGFLNMSKSSFAVALVAGIFQFLQTKQTFPQAKPLATKKDKPDFAAALQTQMLYIFPVLTVFLLSSLPSAVGIYWISTSIFSILQQWYTVKNPKSKTQPSHPTGLPDIRSGKTQDNIKI